MVDFGDDLESVGDVEDVGFAAGPAAVGVEADGAAFVDEAPSDGVGFFAVAASGEAFGMSWCGAGLADLVQMRQEREDSLAFAALVDQRFAAAE